jgi:hypothetical protein
MSNVMIEEQKQLRKECYFELTAVGGGDVVGVAKVDSDGRVYTLVDNKWKKFLGDRVSLEGSFDLKPIDRDPSTDIRTGSLPPRSTS